MRNIFLKILLLSSILVTVSCTITPERHREARIMPDEVAHKILSRVIPNYKPSDIGLNLHPSMALASPLIYKMCDDKNTKFYNWNSIKIDVYNNLGKRIIIRSNDKVNGSFSCFDLGAPYYVGTIDVSSNEDVDDVVDALVSKGVQIDIKK